MSDPERLKQWLDTAMDMERKGKDFYDKAMNEAGNDLARDVFRMLGEEEIVHMDRINRIYDAVKKEGTFTDTWKECVPKHDDLVSIFRDMAKKYGKEIPSTDSDVRALEMGIDFESQSVKFYRDRLGEAQSEQEKEFLEKMVKEEKSHHDAFADMKFYLSDPAGYFREMERGQLDGA
ncbi:MAG: ferritin family protein [bacterium]